MKKKMLAFLMAVSLVMTTSAVFAEEGEGSEASESSEDKEESKEEDSSGDEKSEDEGGHEDSGSDESSRDEGESGSQESSEADAGDSDTGEAPAQDSGDEGSSEQGEAYSEPQDSLYDETTDSLSEGGDAYSGEASGEGAEAYDTAIGEASYEEGVDSDAEFEDAFSAEEAAVTDEGSLEVIVKLIEDGSVPEGTVLREYQSVDDYGNPVLIREVSTSPVTDVAGEEDFDLLDHFGLVASEAPAPTQSNGGWDAYPASYEYNWDNGDTATTVGMFGGNGHLEGYVAATPNDLQVRHKMQMYCDGKDVHLLITYASCFSNPGNGDDYNFYIDGQQVKFKVVYEDDTQLTQEKSEGTYSLKILHEDYSISSRDVLGGSGTMTVKNGQLNNVTEITIPISEMVRQNSNINPDSFSMIEFFTPNLMYRKIATGGASSGPVPFTMMTAVIFGGAYVWNMRRREDEVPAGLLPAV